MNPNGIQMSQNARLQIERAMALSVELGLLTQVYNNRLSQLLREHDVTFPQFTILDYILRTGADGTTVSQISDGVEVLQPAVTKTVKKFSDRGYLTVSSVSNDKRQKNIVMTAEGAGFIGRLRSALLPDVLNCFEDWAEDRLNRFNADLVTFREWLEENRV